MSSGRIDKFTIKIVTKKQGKKKLKSDLKMGETFLIFHLPRHGDLPRANMKPGRSHIKRHFRAVYRISTWPG